jgi:DNA-binding FadR family transcriptional regulator
MMIDNMLAAYKSSKTISNRSLHGRVANELGERIIRGDLKPGEVLPNEFDLIGGLNISRTAYREAIKVLSAKGLVDARQRTGTRVSPKSSWNLLDPDVLAWHFTERPDPQFVRAMFEMRLMFEPRISAMSAVRRTSDQLRAIEAAYEAMTSAPPKSEEIFQADLQFHQAILNASGNDFVVSLGMMIESALLGLFRLTTVRPGNFLHDHGEVLRAIAFQKPDEAHALMRALIREAMGQITNVYGQLDSDFDAVGL